MNEIEEKSIIYDLKEYEVKSNNKIEMDNMHYEDNNKFEDESSSFNPKAYIIRDHLMLTVINMYITYFRRIDLRRSYLCHMLLRKVLN